MGVDIRIDPDLFFDLFNVHAAPGYSLGHVNAILSQSQSAGNYLLALTPKG
jgi:hypothetical protein